MRLLLRTSLLTRLLSAWHTVNELIVEGIDFSADFFRTETYEVDVLLLDFHEGIVHLEDQLFEHAVQLLAIETVDEGSLQDRHAHRQLAKAHLADAFQVLHFLGTDLVSEVLQSLEQQVQLVPRDTDFADPAALRQQSDGRLEFGKEVCVSRVNLLCDRCPRWPTLPWRYRRPEK